MNTTMDTVTKEIDRLFFFFGEGSEGVGEVERREDEVEGKEREKRDLFVSLASYGPGIVRFVFFYRSGRQVDAQSHKDALALAKREARRGQQQGKSLYIKKRRERERESEREESEFSFSFILLLSSCLCAPATKRSPARSTRPLHHPLSVVHGAPRPEPRGPLPRPLAGVAGDAPAPAAGGALFAAVLERAKPLGADRESAATPAELAAAGPGAAAAVARGRGGLSLIVMFCFVVVEEKS